VTEVPRLEARQLQRLEELLAGQGAVVVQRLRPPASVDAIASVEGYLGRPLPRELRTWWGWHDGTEKGKSDEHAAKGLIGPRFWLHSISQAIEVSRESRGAAEEDMPEDPDYLWNRGWLAIGSIGMVACDPVVPADSAVPILDVDYHHVGVPGTVAARSFGEMVGWWIEALESGAWQYEPERDV
jgi:hypothetical protein